MLFKNGPKFALKYLDSKLGKNTTYIKTGRYYLEKKLHTFFFWSGVLVKSMFLSYVFHSWIYTNLNFTMVSLDSPNFFSNINKKARHNTFPPFSIPLESKEFKEFEDFKKEFYKLGKIECLMKFRVLNNQDIFPMKFETDHILSSAFYRDSIDKKTQNIQMKNSVSLESKVKQLDSAKLKEDRDGARARQANRELGGTGLILN